jgi:hypothetical protein
LSMCVFISAVSGSGAAPCNDPLLLPPCCLIGLFCGLAPVVELPAAAASSPTRPGSALRHRGLYLGRGEWRGRQQQ